MQAITSLSGLKNEIRLRETDQAERKQQFADQFRQVGATFKPALQPQLPTGSTDSPHSLVDNLVIPLLGSAFGYLAKNLIVLGSDNKQRQQLGAIIQTEVSSLITRHPETVKSIGRYLYRQIFNRKSPTGQAVGQK